MRKALCTIALCLALGTVARAQCSPFGAVGNVQFLDNSGNVLTNGVLYSFQAGTSTQQATFVDSTCTTQNVNPITFGSGARVAIWLTTANFYKFVLCAQNDGASCAGGDILFSVDQVPGGVTGGGGGGGPPFISGSANPATSGVLRLASGDSTCWRNVANSANLCWKKDTNDLLSWDGGSFKLPEVAAPTPVAGFDILYADSTAHRYKQCNNGAACAQLVASGNDLGTTDQVLGVHFGATQETFGATAPTTGQFVQFNGTNLVGTTQGPAIMSGYCQGVATSSSTLFLVGLGGVAFTCTSTQFAGSIPIPTARTAKNLRVVDGTTGVNASSGVVTVLKNLVATALTCTLGTGGSCSDLVDTVSFAAGDQLLVNFTTQAAETLGGIRVSLELQ